MSFKTRSPVPLLPSPSMLEPLRQDSLVLPLLLQNSPVLPPLPQQLPPPTLQLEPPLQLPPLQEPPQSLLDHRLPAVGFNLLPELVQLDLHPPSIIAPASRPPSPGNCRVLKRSWSRVIRSQASG